MNSEAALPRRFSPDSSLTARSDMPTNTSGRPNWLGEDHPRRMPSSAASSEANVLTLDEMCDWYIGCVLTHCGGNKETTARVLGIGRTSLYRYLKKLECEKPESAIRNRLQDQVGGHPRGPVGT